ncbi:MAG: dienelactone hydrolase family protein [Sandaracinaceae bacterium]
MTLPRFDQTTFEALGESRVVYRAGRGPAVIVMHEVPGITPAVAAFARRVAEAGFSVYLPVMFGTPGRDYGPAYGAASMLRACVSREFELLSAGRASPITDWLRALCRHAHAEQGGVGVGAIGMCISGNFALSLMVDEAVMAPVLSQPSLPVGKTRAQRRGLHVSARELRWIRKRVEGGARVLGLRFTHDPLCPPERFDRLREELGDGFEGIEIDSGPGNAHGIRRLAHSVVTRDLVDQAGHPTRAALDRVMAFFDERLRSGG